MLELESLKNEVIELRRKLEYVYEALGLNMDILATDPAAILKTIGWLDDLMSEPAVLHVDEVVRCCRFFFSITPEYLRLLQQQRRDIWRDIVQFGEALQARRGDEEELRRLLAAARRNLHHATYCYLRGIIGDWADELPDNRDVHTNVLRAIATLQPPKNTEAPTPKRQGQRGL